MLPNFLHPCMQPSVRCSCVASDDHAAHNLLAAPQTREHSSGFVAYAVVRPPVDLVFQLACAVRLHSIEVWTRVGSLRTTGLEVAVLRPGDADFVKVGQVFDLEPTADGALFVADADGDNGSQNSSGGAASGQTPHPTLRRCQFFRTLGRRAAVAQVRITIKCTNQRCAPALRMVRIWAVPAACVPADERQLHLDRWAGRQFSFGFYGTSSSSSSSNSEAVASSASPAKTADASNRTTSSSSSRLPTAEQPIPEDYLDAITCDIMALPMTLPCGKCVDRSTLDRHQSSAASWGRSPSDPFTGLPFTAERRPLLNAALKAQIDRYLLAHQHRQDVRAAPRTVGTTVKRTREGGGGSGGDGPVVKWSRPEASDLAVRCHGCDATEMLYTIRTCDHWICRECLVGGTGQQRLSGKVETTSLCARCKQPFDRADVQRYYDRPIA